MKIISILSVTSILVLISSCSLFNRSGNLSQSNKIQAAQIRALAQDYVIFDQTDQREFSPLLLNTPSILALPDGRLLGSNEREGKEWKEKNAWSRICSSDDGGISWKVRATPNISHGRLFKSDASLYYLGHSNDLEITRSDDNGESWTEPVSLNTGKSSWYASATNVWHSKGNVYLVMERCVYSDNRSGWNTGNLAPILMRAKEGNDLTKPTSWSYSSELAFADLIPGYRENNLQTDFFGVPFYNQKFPDANMLAANRPMYPMGWLETNVIEIQDPNHQWYDNQHGTFHLFMRAHTGGTGYAAIAKVTENNDGTMTTSLVKAPSGKTMLFIPFPGGQMRFHVVYDSPTKLYWLLGTQAINSMDRIDALASDRFQLPNNERQRLVLHYSKNMVDWCFAGFVAASSGNKSSCSYASMDIDGNDLVILARSGNEIAKSAHNGNLITFHRVKNFRQLVY